MRYITANLIILEFVFIILIFGSMGTGIYDSGRIVVILDHNPDIWVRYVRNALLFRVFPIAIGLIFSIITYKKEKDSLGEFHRWPSLLLGAFFFLWGVYLLRMHYDKYITDIRHSREYYFGHVDNELLAIYAAVMLADALWLSTGIFFIFCYIKNYIKNYREKVHAEIARMVETGYRTSPSARNSHCVF